MNKMVCDRCGKEMEKKSVWFENLPRFELKLRKNPVETESVDLCEECLRGLDDWFANKEKECNCNKKQNINVLEVLDQLESAEKHICELSTENSQLKEQNKKLVDGAIQDLLSSCSIKFELTFDKDICGETN